MSLTFRLRTNLLALATLGLAACGGTDVTSNPTLTSIAVTPATATVAAGSTVSLSVAGTKSDGTAQAITDATWTSSQTGIATVSTTGTVTGVAAGSATITASSSGLTATAVITVTAAPAKTLSSIAAAPSTVSLAIGGTQQITVTGTFSDSSTASVTSASTFTTSAAGVATVSTGGLITAVAAGSATITATDGTKTSTVTVTVLPATVTLSSIAVTPSPVAVKVAATAQLVVTGTFSDGSHAAVTSSSTFVSATTSVATVTSGGLVTGVAPGSSVITVTSGTKSTTVTANVATPVLQSIAATPPGPLSLSAAGTQQLTVTGTFDAGPTKNLTSSASFTSNNTAVATVSTGGLITAVAGGSTTISISVTPAGGSAVTTSVTVNVAAVVPNAAVVFVNGYGANVAFEAFQPTGPNASINDINPDPTTTLDINGHQSLKIVYPATSFTGGAWVDNSGPRDLSAFDSITFWAKGNAAASIAVFGLGNNAGFSAHNGFDVEIHGIAVTTAWQQFTIPIPDASKLTSNDGLFTFADGNSHAPFVLWLADIQYQHAGNLGTPTPAWNKTSQALSGTTPYAVLETDLNINYSLPTGPLTEVVPNPNYFTFTSDSSTATVSGSTITNTNNTGGSATANITATLAGVATANHLTMSVASLTAPTAPTTLPPAPTQSAANVISLYSSVSGGYNGTSADKSGNVDTWHTCWTPGPVTGGDPFPITVGAQSAAPRKYTVLPQANSFVGVEFIGRAGPDVCHDAITGTNEIDVSGMDHFHIDVWTPDISDNFQVKLVDAGADKKIDGQETFGIDTITQASTPPIATGKWLSYDVPLSNGFGASNWVSPPTNLKQLAQMVLQAPSGGTFFVDNLYFYKAASSGATGPTTVAAAPTAAANTVLSLFSSTYSGTAADKNANVESFANSCFGPPGTTVADFTIPGTSHVVKQYGLAANSFAIIELIGSSGGTASGTDSPLCNGGSQTGANELNVSAMTTVHFDIWSPAGSGNFQVHLVGAADATGLIAGPGAPGGSPGGSTFVSGANSIATNQWVSFDVPLSVLGPPGAQTSLTRLGLIKFFTTDAGTYYLDNVYFHQ